MARHVADDASNVNSRFEVASEINRKLGSQAPFWGRPAQLNLIDLPTHKTVAYRGPTEPGGLKEWRRVEDRLRDLGTSPQPAWKLFYAGSVGSQTLVGIPVLHRLRNHEQLRGVSQVWPFEVITPTFPAGSPAVVHAAIPLATHRSRGGRHRRDRFATHAIARPERALTTTSAEAPRLVPAHNVCSRDARSAGGPSPLEGARSRFVQVG